MGESKGVRYFRWCRQNARTLMKLFCFSDTWIAAPKTKPYTNIICFNEFAGWMVQLLVQSELRALLLSAFGFFLSERTLVRMAFSIYKRILIGKLFVRHWEKCFHHLSPNDVISLFIFRLIEMCFTVICLKILIQPDGVSARIGNWKRTAVSVSNLSVFF